jgi:serine/threonine protein kinase
MFNAEGALKIPDFGLSRLVAAPHITATDARLGAAAYMSPEQARGEEARAPLGHLLGRRGDL